MKNIRQNQSNISPLNPLEGTLRNAEAPFRRGLGVINLSTKAPLLMPNLLLISGNGRNVGKTSLACKIIRYLAQKEDVIGLKISPHFHTFNENNVIFKNDKFVVVEEKELGTKDSALMLGAGAKQVFYIMAKQEELRAAVLSLKNILMKNPVICESGGLHEIVSPGIFLFVKRSGEEIVKTQFQKYNPVMVNYNGRDFDFDVQNIDFQNDVFSLKK